MKEIKKEEVVYVPLPKFYTFKLREEWERTPLPEFRECGNGVKEMIKDVLNKQGKSNVLYYHKNYMFLRYL